MLQGRFERAHARYEAIVAHELALNTLYMMAGRRTEPAFWDRDVAEIERISAEIAEECRKLRSSCRKFRLAGTPLGIFADASDSPLVRRFTVLEQNAARHPRPRGTVPARPAAAPRPQAAQPAAPPPAPPAETLEPTWPTTARQAPAQSRASTDFGEKLRRALASPGEAIRTENL